MQLRWLKKGANRSPLAVQVNAIVQQHGQLVVFRLIAQHLSLIHI